MEKNCVLFIDMKNNYFEYAECLKIIRNISNKGKIISTSNVKLTVYKYINNNIIPSKLEEPIDGKDMNSSITKIPESEWRNN